MLQMKLCTRCKNKLDKITKVSPKIEGYPTQKVGFCEWCDRRAIVDNFVIRKCIGDE